MYVLRFDLFPLLERRARNLDELLLALDGVEGLDVTITTGAGLLMFRGEVEAVREDLVELAGAGAISSS